MLWRGGASAGVLRSTKALCGVKRAGRGHELPV